MNMVDILSKKRAGQVLTEEELQFSFMGYLKGEVPDYQMSSLLMAICIRGMSEKEVFALTDIFIQSGEILDLSEIDGVVVDKHSTGGVGDKTTLVVGPIVAACGVKFAKMSGRGLGFTGGTIDKLESIPGFRTSLSKEEFVRQVNDIGIAITSQTANLVPLDKMIYALRDVTGTVESIPLIAVSIMSKKIASGANNIMLDVKVGSGALLKTKEEALAVARLMKKIGAKYHKHVETIITYMDIPLGTSIGNTLEVVEVMKILKGGEDNYLVALSKSLASQMIAMGKGIEMNEASVQVEEVIKNGKAYEKFVEFVRAQGGDLSRLTISKNLQRVYAPRSGRIVDMDAYQFGRLSVLLGGGRIEKEDVIDPSVGIVLNKKIGDEVKEGDVLCTLCLKRDAEPVSLMLDEFYVIEEEEVKSEVSLLDDSKDSEALEDTSVSIPALENHEKEEDSSSLVVVPASSNPTESEIGGVVEKTDDMPPDKKDELLKDAPTASVSSVERSVVQTRAERYANAASLETLKEKAAIDEKPVMEKDISTSIMEDSTFSSKQKEEANIPKEIPDASDSSSDIDPSLIAEKIVKKDNPSDINLPVGFPGPIDMSDFSMDDLILMNASDEQESTFQ